MKIQQSGFRIYRFILNRIPSFAFKIIILLLVMLITVDFSLSFFAKPTFNISKCLNEYYQLSHINATERVQQLMESRGIRKGMNIIIQKNDDKVTDKKEKENKEESKPQNLQDGNGSKSEETQTITFTIKRDDIEEAFSFTNTSTVLRIFTSPSLTSQDSCIIQLNYQYKDDEPNGQKIKPEEKLKEIVHKQKESEIALIFSSKFALYFNDTDVDILKKHDLHFHKIVIPQVQTGFRYLWMNSYRNMIDDFVWGLWQSLKEVHLEVNQQWKKEAEELSDKGPAKEDKQNEDSKLTENYEILKINNTRKVLSLLQQNQNSIFSDGHELRFFPVPGQSPVSRPLLGDSLLRTSLGIFSIILYFILIIFLMYLSSIFISLFVKYGFITIIGLLQIFVMMTEFKSFKKSQGGFINKYYKMMYNGSQNKIKLAIQITISILSIPALYACISYIFVIATFTLSFQFLLPTSPMQYSFLNIILTIQIVHYIFLRSRISLRFFGVFSVIINLSTLLFLAKYPYYYSTFLIHLDLLCQLLIIWIFLFLEKLLLQEQFDNQFKPSPNKPRMLFFMGYDLDWQHSVPPLWTAISFWYDLSYISNKERARIDNNYELLYGCLMGMDREQQIPDQNDSDQEFEIREQSIRQMNEELRAS